MKFSNSEYSELASCIRILSIDAVQRANSGHPGMPLGMADVATVLFTDFLRFAPQDPKWPNRDRFVLSAGHGSMLLYSLLYLTGYNDISLEDLKNFRTLLSKTPGHPEYGTLEGVECTTGPLGQGLGMAVGMAIASKISQTQRITHGKFAYADELQEASELKTAAYFLVREDLKREVTQQIAAEVEFVYCLVGDGCLMEGISHEAASLAGHLKLNNLIVLFDSNSITIDGKKSLADSEDTTKRFQAYGWNVEQTDGHSYEDIHSAISSAKNSSLPTLIICKTIIGLGSPNKQGTEKCHGSPLGEVDIRAIKESYGYDPDKSFEIPPHLLEKWRSIGQAYANEKSKHPDININHLKDVKSSWSSNASPEATRKSSQLVLDELFKAMPEYLIGGSADLTESNLTLAKGMHSIAPGSFSGNYIHYGIREHAMGAILNGLALYGNFIPYGGTFLVFSDYLRPAIRLSAVMKLGVIYVFTHDSIALGEDGATHQPIEHLASLRAMPDLLVFRPADRIETLECWELAIQHRNTPSALCLTRQSVSQLRKQYVEESLCSKGAYILSEATKELSVTIFATGSEVEIAILAQTKLHEIGIGTRVISMPCMELFDAQTTEYKNSILGNDSVKVAIEAGVKFGWEKYIGVDGIFIGMHEFGLSAPGLELYKHFDITAQGIINKVLEQLKTNKACKV